MSIRRRCIPAFSNQKKTNIPNEGVVKFLMNGPSNYDITLGEVGLDIWTSVLKYLGHISVNGCYMKWWVEVWSHDPTAGRQRSIEVPTVSLIGVKHFWLMLRCVWYNQLFTSSSSFATQPFSA